MEVASLGLRDRPLMGDWVISLYLPSIARIYLFGRVNTAVITSAESIALSGRLILVMG